MSYVSSAGGHGTTCRQDVLRRVNVPERAAGAMRGLPAAPRLERGIASTPGEERSECGALLTQRLLQRDRRDFVKDIFGGWR